MPDLNAIDLDGAIAQVAGTARSMGIEVTGLQHHPCTSTPGGGPRRRIRVTTEGASFEGERSWQATARSTVDARAKLRPRAAVRTPTEALELVKSLATRKFDETVEAAFRLGVDPRKADQMIRGTVSLPNGTGKSARVAVFAAGRRRP